MEYMRLEGFLGGAVSKLINKAVAEKIGFKPNISINQFKLYTDENTNADDTVIVNMAVSMTQSDFNKLLEEVTK